MAIRKAILPVATTLWLHTQIEGIDFVPPWDSVCDIDYISVYSIPEPFTLSLLALGGLAVMRRRRKASPSSPLSRGR